MFLVRRYYHVAGRLIEEEDFHRFFDLVVSWYAGTISGARFERELVWFRRKYNLTRSELYTLAREAMELFRAGRLYVIIPLRKVLQKFRRFVRKGREVFVVGAQLCVFSLADHSFECLEHVMDELVHEQVSRWGPALEPTDRYSAEIYLLEDEFEGLRKYLESFNSWARTSDCWAKYRYTPPPDFNVIDHVLSYFEICGIEEHRFTKPNETIRRYLELEDVCKIVRDYVGSIVYIPSGVVSASLYVFADCEYRPRCQLWKVSGWRPPRTPYGTPPAPPKRPGRPAKTTAEAEGVSGISFTPRPKEFPNPLADFDLRDVPEKFRETLEFCKRYGLNPIPLAPNSKMPLKGYSHGYLAYSPIRRDDLQYFYDTRYNIGIYAGYGNLVIVDVDVKEMFPIKTAYDESKRGYHFYIRTDPEFFNYLDLRKVYTVRRDGKLEAILHIKTSGYVVAPRSVVDGFEYRWVSRDLAYVPANRLVMILKTYAGRVMLKYGSKEGKV